MNERFPLFVGLALLWLPRAVADDPVFSLDVCVNIARTNNPVIRRAERAWANRRLDTRMARARFAVTLSGSARWDIPKDTATETLELKKEFPAGITLGSTLTLNEGGDAEADGESLSVSLSKRLLGGGSYRASRLEIERSLLDEQIAANTFRKTCREIVFRVRQAYYRVVRSQELLRMWELRLEASRHNLERARERENPLDIATATLEIPHNEAAVLAARHDIEEALDSLKEVLGFSSDRAMAVDTHLAFREETVNLTNDLAYCLENHEDILNARLVLRKLEEEWEVQAERVWPTVTLSGTALQTEPHALSLGEEWEYAIGLSATWGLGAVAERAHVEKLKNESESQRIAVEALKRERENLVRELARRVEQARQFVRLQEKRLAFAEQRAALYADRWENGEIDILEYVRSQNELQDNRAQLLSARMDYLERVARYQLEVGR